MGIISPKKPNNHSKALIVLLAITLSPFVIMVVLFYLLWGAFLYLAIWLTWKKPRVLFVYSNSPIWKEYIETEILPYIQNRAMILNWSERRNWKPSLAVLAFRYFGGDRNFNPIGMVFRPLRFVKTYRFFKAFKEFKHGNPKQVEEIKQELFEVLRLKR
jgi:hypothetical protein